MRLYLPQRDPETQRKLTRLRLILLGYLTIFPLLWLLGPRETFTEFNPGTWQLRQSRAVFGVITSSEMLHRGPCMWHAPAGIGNAWELGPQAYLGASTKAGSWQLIERSNEGLLRRRPDLGFDAGGDSQTRFYQTMAESLLELALTGSYGPANPSIGRPDEAARRQLAENARQAYSRANDPAEALRYLVYAYERELWTDPQSHEWRKDIDPARTLTAAQVPSLQDFDSRGQGYPPEDYLAWWGEG